ncbi:uncharacterized protein LOC121389390 isoform X2 [Gigantopelta aegis]|uniref:uncharacterized protein LOC121389390 isoform X2 n=1 Tax=Gigantopelta aegis TaxID=1735272 RepID=UPI001B889A92|nr:uncharacterized protein LOC121389390 isoform X2 [Gigantopelta aegis]
MQFSEMASFLRGLQLLPRIGQRILQITSSIPAPPAPHLNLLNTRLLSSSLTCQCPERRLLSGPAILAAWNNQVLTCFSPPLQQPPCRTYKVKTALKRRCSGCYFVKRHGRLFVECKVKPRHKQMQKMRRHKLYKEDYSKGPIQAAVNWRWRNDRYYWLGDNKFARHDWLDGKIGRTV